MLSLASLLNPVASSDQGAHLSPKVLPSAFNTTSAPQAVDLIADRMIRRPKMSKDGAVFAKAKPKGVVNYPPFEHLNEEMKREIRRFQVYPLGKIEDYSRHIPYNSEKKSFLERTGRESVEVFQYVFKVPGEDKEYTVMWDYNIGLVRITPFFKCCKYSKTTPAKMLNMNPGLKEITHSITGGALAAQGYWMPYSCAMAVCATFCHHIAPALVPIFGPDFPSMCVLPDAPEHGRMIIDHSIILSATAEAEAFRRQYSAEEHFDYPVVPATSPRRDDLRITPPTTSFDRKTGTKRMISATSTYAETDTSDSSSCDGRYSHTKSPATPSSSMSLSNPYNWRPYHEHNVLAYDSNCKINVDPSTNQTLHPYGNIYHGSVDQLPNPILSAIPRSIGVADIATMSKTLSTPSPSSYHTATRNRAAKRRIIHDEDDCAYDGEESSTSMADEKMSITTATTSERDVGMSRGNSIAASPQSSHIVTRETSSSESDKNAAMLLLNLSVQDGSMFYGSDADSRSGLDLLASSAQRVGDGADKVERPRVKRRRAASM